MFFFMYCCLVEGDECQFFVVIEDFCFNWNCCGVDNVGDFDVDFQLEIDVDVSCFEYLEVLLICVKIMR